MQIAYHQQYKDLDDRQIIDLVLSDESEIQMIKRANMDIPFAQNYIGIRPGLIEHRKFTSFCHSQSGCELSAFIFIVVNMVTVIK